MTTRTRKRRMVVLSGARSYLAYIALLSPLVWLRLNEATGETTAVNSGSLGATFNGTYSNCTLAQTGKIGPSSAVSYNGTTSRLQIANGAGLANLTTWTYAALVNPTNAGEGGGGQFWDWGNAVNEPYAGYNGVITSLAFRLADTTPTAFNTTTTTGLTASTWQWLFATFDNAGDRKLHAYRGVASAVAEFAYGAQPVMVGTYKTPISPLNIGNNTATSATFAGLYDELLVFNAVLTQAQMQQIVKASGA